MTDKARVEQMLEEIFESDRTPEEICADCPELLAEVRFLREAEAAAALRHANIVQVYDMGEHDGRPFFTMELVEGGNLQAKVAGTPQPAFWAASLTATLAGAVHFAHQHGIIHRDLKPSNTSYGPNTGTRGWASVFAGPPKIDDGVFLVTRTQSVRIADITDGTSSTILFGEAYHRDPLWKTFGDQCMWHASQEVDELSQMAAWWFEDTHARNASAPINWQLTPSDVAGPFTRWSPPCRDLEYKRLGAYGSGHGGGANVVMADGSVH
jgi:prepilin-type processing-associated H-X9-DG protein